MTINFPFSKLGIVMGDPIYLPREARAEEFERYQKQSRRRLTTSLQEPMLWRVPI
jgi:lysophospholipid acyltransferase (LPLAT)-like uncharacterized protein